MLIKNDKDKLPKLFSSKSKKIFIVTLLTLNVVFVFAIIVLFFNSTRFKNNINFRVNQITSLFVPKSYELSLDKLKNIFKYALVSNFINVKVPKLLINANFKNTNEFYNQLKYSEERDNNKNYSKGSLTSSSDTYKIKFRPKGDRKIHYKKNKPSFSVEILDGKSFLGMKKFSLQSPEIRNYLHELLWIELLKKNDIISPKYFFNDLVFNGQNMGIYNYEEKPTTFMLERLGYKNSSILKFSEADGFLLKYNPEIKVINYEDVLIKNQNISTSILRNFVLGKSKVRETFDLEKLANFFAISTLMKTYHGLMLKSMRFYYNPFTNLLEPIPFDGHASDNPLILLNECITDCDTLLNEPYLSSWLNLFFNDKNRDFIDLYFEKLIYFSSNEYLNSVINDKNLENIINDALKIIYKDFTFQSGSLMPYFSDYSDYLNQNALKIKAKLNLKSNIQFYSSFYNNSIQIHSLNFDNIVPANIESLESENFKFNVKKKISFYKSNKNILEKFNINDSMLNDILINKKLKINYSSFLGDKIVRNVNLFEHKYSLGGYSNDYLNSLLDLDIVSIENDNVYFNKSDVTLEDLLIIPSNKTLVLDSNQKIRFKNESGVILYGDIFFNGTTLNPINLLGDNDKINGSGFILAIGSSKIVMKNVNFINLSSFDMFDIPGSVTFYNSKVDLENINFVNNFSEDYLNFVNAKFSLKNIVFENCNSDCIDADFSNGKLNNVKFNNSGNDGLDISESKINIDKIYFNKIGDKAISAGENSKIILENIKISNSEIGIVSKDGSIIQGDKVNINLVKLPIAIFKKKPRYSNPSISIKNYFESDSEIKYLIEKPLHIKLNSKKIIGDIIRVENLLYGNIFGTNTKKSIIE